MNAELQKEASRIADDIVALVERTDGPVTLCRVHREVPGFAQSEPPYRTAYREAVGRQVVLWAQMSAAGLQALDTVLHGNRVAVEVVNDVPYLLDGGVLVDEAWQPIVLHPVRDANVSTKNGLFRMPDEQLTPERMLKTWQRLNPPPRTTH